MIIRSLLSAIVWCIPNFNLGTDLLSVLTSCWSWFLWGNHYLPLDCIPTLVILILSSWIVCAVVKVLLQVL